MSERTIPEQSKHRTWVLVASWFGTIAFIGLLKRILDHQQSA